MFKLFFLDYMECGTLVTSRALGVWSLSHQMPGKSPDYFFFFFIKVHMTQLIPISKLFEKEKKKMRKQDKVEKGGKKN